MDIQFVKRHEEVLPTNLSLLEKIGRMACICYRSEIKEGEDVKERYSRIIRSCIKNGHESILEHGVISLYIAPGSTEDGRYLRKIFLPNEKNEQMVVGFRNLWTGCLTEVGRKYIDNFVDGTILDTFMQRTQPGTHPEHRPLECLIGDVRAWRNVVKEIAFLSTNVGQPLFFLFAFRLLKEMMTVEPILFEDIQEEFNSFLKSEIFKNLTKTTEFSKIAEVMKDRELTVDSIVNEFMKDPQTMFAAQSDPSASLSVIITTDRATTHQLVRHRKSVAYSQESQRYCNYNKKGLRIIPFTLDPAKYPKSMPDNERSGLVPTFVDEYRGEVNPQTQWFDIWKKGIQSVANTYEELLGSKVTVSPDKLIEHEDSFSILPETARGVLPNDTATTIGVTWMMTSGFANYVYWRLDQHAQYPIRSMIARIIEQAYAMKHPYIQSINCELVIRWLTSIRDQNLASNPETINSMIESHKKFRDFLEKQIEEMRKKKQEAEVKK